MGDEGKMKKRVVVESLGWLTESSIMPKKHKAIAGVGAASILELKAHLYQSQEESKKSKELAGPGVEFHRAKKMITPKNVLSSQNPGVEARDHKDKLELKAIKDGSVSYAALEKKAAIYDKLVKGELPDEEDQEKYCVDFFRKNLEQDESQLPQDHNASASGETDAPEEEDEPSFLFNSKTSGLGRTSVTMDNNEHKRFVREVHEEVNLAREKASELKLLRQEQATARREKLKLAYLRKQVEKLKASSNSGQT